jgi:hypothetical protein
VLSGAWKNCRIFVGIKNANSRPHQRRKGLNSILMFLFRFIYVHIFGKIKEGESKKRIQINFKSALNVF